MRGDQQGGRAEYSAGRADLRRPGRGPLDGRGRCSCCTASRSPADLGDVARPCTTPACGPWLLTCVATPRAPGRPVGRLPDRGDRRRVRGLVDAAGLDQVHLVGHDWGGAAAWATAGLHVDRVASLTVLSTPHPGGAGRWSFTPPPRG